MNADAAVYAMIIAAVCEELHTNPNEIIIKSIRKLED